MRHRAKDEVLSGDVVAIAVTTLRFALLHLGAVTTRIVDAVWAGTGSWAAPLSTLARHRAIKGAVAGIIVGMRSLRARRISAGLRVASRLFERIFK